MSVIILFLVVLLVTGIVLIWEARTGRLTPNSNWSASLRAALFFAAAVVGIALLGRTASASWLFALALAPVTVLSLVRFVMVVRPAVQRPFLRAAASLAVLGIAMLVGVSASLALLPREIDQKVIMEQIFHRDAPSDARSIDPAARRTART